jgi:hypothetical protein
MPISTTQRLPLGPNRPFVDRETELALIKAKIQAGCQMDGKIPLAVTCFWGASGIGKSCLLEDIESRYRRDGSCSTEECRTIAVRISLSKSTESANVFWSDQKFAAAQVVPELWKQLTRQMGAQLPDLANYSPEQVAKAFVHQISRWVNGVTSIILLDTLDDVVREDEQAFFWLEEHLIEPLALTDRVLFVLASRGELRRWKRFQVSRRVDLIPIKAFKDPSDLGHQVKADEQVGEVLYQHSFGHPFATRRLGDWLQEHGVDLQKATPTEVENALDTSTVTLVLDPIIKDILEHVQAKDLVKAISVLRWVNVEPVRYLTEELGLVEHKLGDAYFLDLIGQIQARHILYWDIQTTNYRCDPSVRRLIAHSLELNNEKYFEQAHIKAREFHQQHLDKYPEYLAHYIPELAYHTAILTQHGQSSVQPFREWWNEFLTRAPQHPDPWIDLLNRLWGSEKNMPLDNELQEVWGHTEYAWLVNEVRTRAYPQ